LSLNNPDLKDKFQFLPRKGSEMSALIRQFNWENTLIGDPSSWPQSLKSTLSIIMNSKFPMFLWWGKDLIQFYNDAYRPSLGNSGKHPGALGATGLETWSEIWHYIKPLIDRVLAGGEASWDEDRLLPIFRNGRMEDVYWTFSYSPVIDETGKPNGVFVTCTETTEKVVNVRDLKESREQLQFAVDAAELSTWDLDPKTNKFIANDRLKQWFGLTPEENIDLDLALHVIKENDRPIVIAAIQYALTYSSGGFYDVIYTIVHPVTGVERIVHAKGRALFNDAKEPVRFNGTIQDITSETILKRKTERNQENLKNVFNQSPVAMMLFKGPDHIVELANKHALLLWGRTEKEIIGKSIFDVLTDIKRSDFENILRGVYDTGDSYSAYGQKLTLKSNGHMEDRYVNYTYEPFRETDGRITGIMAAVLEVTEEVLARQRTEEAESKARLAIDSADLGTYEIDLKTDEMITSARFDEIWGIQTGMTRNEIVERIHPEDRETRLKAHELSLVTGNLHYEARLLLNDGNLRWARVKGKVIYDDLGSPETLLGVIQDITESKFFAEKLTSQVAERTLELQRSNEDLLQFAHVASHDLKEPVRKIKTFANRLQSESVDLLPAKSREYLNKIQNSTDRMYKMIEGVLAYSELNVQDLPIEEVGLNEVIKNVSSDLEILIHQKNATIKKTTLPVIEGAPVLLYQLFFNLMNNALKFSKPELSPVIKISARTFVQDDKKMAKIIFSDNGIGFEPIYAETIFGTFARLHAKETYEGTGLGLALCKKIVFRHHGSIRAESTLGEGSDFIILLPLKQGKKI
jgi:PAS domain S-box-containing protein